MTKRFFIYTLPFASSLLLALSFSRYQLGWLVAVGLIPLLYFLHLSFKQGWGWPKILLYTWLAGLVFFLLHFIWMLDIQPESWARIPELSANIGVGFVWLYVALVFSISFLVFGGMAIWLKRWWDKPWLIILLPASWVVAEYLHGWLFSIAVWGPGSSIGPYWNFGALGLGAATTPVAGLSRIIGLYGLSFLVVALNIAVFWLLGRRWRIAWPALGIIAGLAVLGLQLYKPNAAPPTLRVGIVQLDNYHDDYTKRLLETVPAGTNLDLLVLPEYAYFEQVNTKNRAALLAKLFPDQTGFVVTAQEQADTEHPFTELRFYDARGNLIASQQKNFLIPVGEYLPKIIEALLTVTTNQQAVAEYQQARVHSQGVEPEQPQLLGNIKVGALVCSGVIAPELYRRLVDQGAELLINTASLGIFGNNEIYFEQAKAMARFQAVANRRPFVQATRGGYSYVIDSAGKFQAETQRRQEDFVITEVTSDKTKTLYSSLGELSLPLSILALGGAALLSLKTTRRH